VVPSVAIMPVRSALPSSAQGEAALRRRPQRGIIASWHSILSHQMNARYSLFPKKGTEIDARIGREAVWVTPAQMAKLFERELSVIHRHIRNTFSRGEVPDERGYPQNLPTTAPTGGRPEVACNLDVIISVGNRAKSQRGVDFRRWATRVIKERLIGEYRKRAGGAAQVLAA